MSPRSGNPQPERLYKTKERKNINKNFILFISETQFLFSSLLCFMNIAELPHTGGAGENGAGAHRRPCAADPAVLRLRVQKIKKSEKIKKVFYCFRFLFFIFIFSLSGCFSDFPGFSSGWMAERSKALV